MNVNNEWKKTCKVLLGEEVGDISKYEAYLMDLVEPVRKMKSVINGAEIAVSGKFCEGTKFIAGDEISEYGFRFMGGKLDVDSIKDIDSIVEAVKEKVCYTGSTVLGNSADVILSNRLIDSTSVSNSHQVCYSRNVAYCYIVRYSEHVFGSSGISKTNMCIKSFETFEDSRLFETVRTYTSSDCYYTANVEGSQNCMFSFNLRNKRNCIGNLELPQDKFQVLKAKLLEDLRQTLESKCNLPSIARMIGEVN